MNDHYDIDYKIKKLNCVMNLLKVKTRINF